MFAAAHDDDDDDDAVANIAEWNEFACLSLHIVYTYVNVLNKFTVSAARSRTHTRIAKEPHVNNF